VKADKKLGIVGDAPYASGYKRELRKTKDPRTIFTRCVYGQGYLELQSHAFCYVHATEVGGTHPALLDGMSLGRCVLVNGTPENLEVIGDTGIVYKNNDLCDLREKLSWVLGHLDERTRFNEKARKRIFQSYTWDRVADQYEHLFSSILETQK
jgi:glycosyltransferase involved in cell wall biosynthesis